MRVRLVTFPSLFALVLAACGSCDAADSGPIADGGPTADGATRVDGATEADGGPTSDASSSGDAAPPPAEGSQMSAYVADDTTDFPNPERGWYIENDFTEPATRGPVASVAARPTLSMRFVRLDTYQDAPLPTSFLDDLASEMDSWRTTGTKAVLRFGYNRTGTGRDAPIDVVLGHIDQLAPLLRDYEDVIAVMQAGFIGLWGEWHGSTHDLRFGSNSSGLYRDQIKDALLAAAPTNRMVEFRTPNLLGPPDLDSSYRFGWYTTTPALADRFDGAEQSRVALHNDCFLDGMYNGSWYDPWDGTTVDRDHTIVAAVTRITATGGETCSSGGLNASNTCSAALAEMAASSWDYLNSEYWTELLDRWQEQGCLAEISRRLGYRFVLTSATAPTTVYPGGAMRASLTLTNAGFGKLYNPRPLQIVFTGSDGPFVATALEDARRAMPLGGDTTTIELAFTAPIGLMAGERYDLYVRMPDPSPHLEDDPRQMIRFANEDVWSASDGWNDLGMAVTVGP